MATSDRKTSLLRTASDSIPKTLKAPVAVGLNFAISSLLMYLAAPWIANDLDAVNRPLANLSDYTGLLAIKALTTLGYWLGGWDAKQAAALNTLALAPILHYLHTYQPSHAPLLPTLSAYTAIELASVYLPLKFLRPSPQRRHSTDSTRTFTALLVCSVYQLSIHLASNYFLTTYLLGAGWDLESTVRVHAPADAAVLIRGLLMLPIGYAASDVIFFTEDAAEKEDGEALRGLVGIVKGLWRKLSPRTRGIVKRTLAVVVYQTAGAVKSASSVKGGNWQGAAAMSGVWAASTLLVGAVLGWVGNVDL